MAADPFLTLGLSPEPRPTPAAVRTAWRALASRHHPDRGGDAATFHAYRAAYEEALRRASEPVECPTCRGAGVATVRRGWAQTTLPCPQCGGAGYLDRGDDDESS